MIACQHPSSTTPPKTRSYPCQTHKCSQLELLIPPSPQTSKEPSPFLPSAGNWRFEVLSPPFILSVLQNLLSEPSFKPSIASFTPPTFRFAYPSNEWYLFVERLAFFNSRSSGPGTPVGCVNSVHLPATFAAVALIAGLWGVNNHMAQQAYDASPQLQKLTAYLEVAKQHNDQRMIDQLEQRIENHKMRISIGKGEVMGKDGEPIDVVYDKEKSDGGSIASKMNWNEEKQRLDPKCWKGYKKQGTKMKGGVRVNNCVKA